MLFLRVWVGELGGFCAAAIVDPNVVELWYMKMETNCGVIRTLKLKSSAAPA
jgi:hypothetical protein